MENIEKLPPQAVDMEAAVLGSIMLDPTAAEVAFEMLSAEDFYRQNHRLIFEVALELFNEERGVDQGLIAERLDAKQILDTVGGIAYLVDVVGSCATSAHITSYAQIVRDAAIKRRLIATGTDMVRMAFEKGTQPENIIDVASAELTKLDTRLAGGKQQVSIRDLIVQVIEGFGGRNPREAFPTGIYDLDRLLGGGFMEGELGVVAARPGCGKSTLLQQVMRVAASTGKPCLMLSYEMTSVAITQALVAGHARVCIHKDGTVRDDCYAQAMEASKQLESWPVYLYEDAPDIDRVPSLVRKYVKEHGIRLVLVDYLQEIPVSGRQRLENRNEAVGHIVRVLKRCATSNNIAVIAASQMNRAANQAANSRSTLARLRESGSIEQAADVVVFLHDPEGDTRIGDRPLTLPMDIIVAKQRGGNVGTLKANWQTGFRNFESEALPPWTREEK